MSAGAPTNLAQKNLIDKVAQYAGLDIRAKIFGLPDRRPTRDQKFSGCPTEFRATRNFARMPESPENPNSGRARASFRARKPEFSEHSRILFLYLSAQFYLFFYNSIPTEDKINNLRLGTLVQVILKASSEAELKFCLTSASLC